MLIFPFLKKDAYMPSLPTLCVSGGKKCSFFGKFGVLYFLVASVLRFALLPYYRRIAPPLTTRRFHLSIIVIQQGPS